MPVSEKILYLSFDDGPHPRITSRVLDILKEAGAKATFFCLGKNAEAYPEIYQRILQEGHAVGNHSHDHPNGLQTVDSTYLASVIKAAKVIDSNLFRPPYGRMRGSQEKKIMALGLKPVMWTVLSGDYDEELSHEACAQRVISNIRPGNIFLFHDSERAERRMIHALERLLDKGKKAGYVFAPITLSK